MVGDCAGWAVDVAKLIKTHASPNTMMILQWDSNKNTNLLFYLHPSFESAVALRWSLLREPLGLVETIV